jgi:hypothetical protein
VQTPSITLDFAHHAAQACVEVGITDPLGELPAYLALADTAQRLNSAHQEHAAAMSAWLRCSTANPHDDAAHEDHRIRTTAARNALIGAQAEFDTALIQLEAARGNLSLPLAPETQKARIAHARSLVGGFSREKAEGPDRKPRFTEIVDAGQVIVRDHHTGLDWARSAVCRAANWQAAHDHCANLRTHGHNDWRLPEIAELLTLVDYTRSKPAADPVFASLPTNDWYWSNSAFAGDADNAWSLYFGLGDSYAYDRHYSGYALAVRGGSPRQSSAIGGRE